MWVVRGAKSLTNRKTENMKYQYVETSAHYVAQPNMIRRVFDVEAADLDSAKKIALDKIQAEGRQIIGDWAVVENGNCKIGDFWK